MSLYPNFARPRNLTQAAELLASLSSGKIIIAGGQELMPSINLGQLQPDVYVDIGALDELRGIAVEDNSGRLSIGSLTVHRELTMSPLVRERAPLLAIAAAQAGGGRQVHNRGTIGGNIVAMHPLYDFTPALLALDAEVEIQTGNERLCRRLAEVIADSRHGLGSDAILVRVLVPAMEAGVGYAYEKLKQTGGAYGSANAAALVKHQQGQIQALRLCIGAATERVIDASDAAAFLLGKGWSEEAATQLRATVRELVTVPLSDQQGDGAWRAAMAGVVASRAIAAALKMHGDNG